MENANASPAAVEDSSPPDVIVRGNASGFHQEIESGVHRFEADEPLSVGGADKAPTPYDYLLAGLGGCTSMTIGLYARRLKWPLEEITIALRHSRIHAKDCEDCETKQGMLDRIEMDIELTGPLTAEQHAKLIEVAHKCPVHRTMTSEIDVRVKASQPATSG